MATPPKASGVGRTSDPLASILGSAEWLTRPGRHPSRDGGGGSPHPGGHVASNVASNRGGAEVGRTGSSPVTRPDGRVNTSGLGGDGGRGREGGGGLSRDGPSVASVTDGHVWLGTLRLSGSPWMRGSTNISGLKNRGRAGGLREEDLRGPDTSNGGSRETSVETDGSGASDGNPEVTMEETPSQKKRARLRGVNFSHEGSNAQLLGRGGCRPGGGRAGVRTAATADAEEADGPAGGDGNSSVGEEEGEEEMEMSGANERVTDAAAVEADAEGGRTPTAPLDPRGSINHERHRLSSSEEREHREEKNERKAGSRKGSFSGADVTGGRHAGRARAARGNAGATLACSLIARPPPSDAGIPGTSGGEGQARAAAAGNAMPTMMEACIVRPRSEGWPDVWNPVALLCLYPYCEDSFHNNESFDRLSSLLTPRTLDEDETDVDTETVGDADAHVGAVGGGLEVEASETTEADDTISVHSGGSMAGVTTVIAAARVELERGYVAFIVSSELLPADVQQQVGMTAGAGEGAEGADPKKPSPRLTSSGGGGGGGGEGGTLETGAEEAVSGEEDGVTGPAAGAAASLGGASGGAEGSKSARMRPGVAVLRKQAAAEKKMQAARRPLWVIIQSDEPPAPPEAVSAVPAPDVRPTRGILRHRHSKANNGAVIGGHGSHVAPQGHVATDWAADALALATSSPGRTAEEFAEEFHFSDDPGSSPDIHSGVSSGESSGDEGSDGCDPLSSSAVSGHGGWSRSKPSLGNPLNPFGEPPGVLNPPGGSPVVGVGVGPVGVVGPTAVASSGVGMLNPKPPGVVGAPEHFDGVAAAAAARDTVNPPPPVFISQPVPIDGMRFSLLGFDVTHPHIQHLLSMAEARGALFVAHPTPESVDLIIIHPPFLPMLGSPVLPLTISEFLRRRSVRFALGLRHLELCLEQNRRLDPRKETLEVFPEGVLLVVDESALLSSDGVVERLAKLLGQAAAAAAAAAAARGEFHYGASGVREPPPWPWAIKVHQGIFHTLVLQKLNAQRAPSLPTPEGNAALNQAIWRVESVLKALHTLRAQGDRNVRGARLLGITWEESSHQSVDAQNPAQAARIAAKIAAKHAALCRVVFLVSESPQALLAARQQRSILASGVDGAAAFLEELIAEMWGETVAASAKPWANGVGSGVMKERGDGTDGGPPIAPSRRGVGASTSFDGVLSDGGGSDRSNRGAVGSNPGGGGRARSSPNDANDDGDDLAPGSPDSRAARAEGDSELPSDSGPGGSLGSLGGGSIADGACSGEGAGGRGGGSSVPAWGVGTHNPSSTPTTSNGSGEDADAGAGGSCGGGAGLGRTRSTGSSLGPDMSEGEGEEQHRGAGSSVRGSGRHVDRRGGNNSSGGGMVLSGGGSGIIGGVAGGSSGGHGASSHHALYGRGGAAGSSHDRHRGHGSHSSSAHRHKSVRFATTIDDGGKRTGSRGRYSPPPSPPRPDGRTPRESREDTPPGSRGGRDIREDTPPTVGGSIDSTAELEGYQGGTEGSEGEPGGSVDHGVGVGRIVGVSDGVAAASHAQAAAVLGALPVGPRGMDMDLYASPPGVSGGEPGGVMTGGVMTGGGLGVEMVGVSGTGSPGASSLAQEALGAGPLVGSKRGAPGGEAGEERKARRGGTPPPPSQ